MDIDSPSGEREERIDGSALRRAAEEEGFPISDRLLETLRGQDLIPRPTRVGHRGRSPVWAYPPTAVRQLLVLLRWRQHTKDPDALRILLWVDGYAIPTSDVRDALVRWLENTHDSLDREIRTHAHRIGLDPDREENRPVVLQDVSRTLAAKRGPGSIPRRGRVPAAERAHAIDVLLRRFMLDIPVEGDIEHEAQKIEKVLGIAPGRTGTVEGNGPWLTGPAAPLLNAADILALPRLLDTARSATDDELDMARQTVRVLFQFLPLMIRIIGVITGDDNHIGMAGIRDIDHHPEFLFYLTPMIVAMLRAGWTDNLQTVTSALGNVPELVQQAQGLLELPAALVQKNFATQPSISRERAQRLIEGALSGEFDLAPRRT